MRHNTINRPCYQSLKNAFLAFFHQSPMQRILAAALFTLTLTNLSAQTSSCLVCSGTTNIYMDADCSVLVKDSTILMGTQTCTGPYALTLKKTNGEVIPNNILTSQHVGQNIMATVRHIASGNTCWGNVYVFDTLAPTIACTNYSVFCNQSTASTALSQPTVTDNCSGPAAVTLTQSDISTANGTCADSYMKRIVRRWTATDQVGKSSTCNQIITVVRPTLAQVTFPADLTISNVTSTLPTVTGEPKINGNVFLQSTCNLSATPKNLDTMVTCRQNGQAVEYEIRREWKVMEHCGNTMKKDTQTIYVRDLIPATITCPTIAPFGTVTDQCYANIAALPAPTTNNPLDSVAVIWMYGEGFGPFNNVPPGTYTVQYKSFDCNTSATCTTDIVVKDTQTPTVRLSGNMTVALSAGGTATMPANYFNAGSFDNCDQVNVTVSKNGINFGPSVTFNCGDVGGQVMVTVKISEVHNPASFAIGMVGVTVQDKIGPTLDPQFTPQNLTIDCTLDYRNPTAAPVNPVFNDNCGLANVVYDTTNNVSACGVGTFLRKFTAYDIHGNSTVFVQTITVTNNNVFNASKITWPPDYSTNVCGASLQPNDIPAAFRAPVINNNGCGQVAVNYTDQVFNIAAPACFKVMRRWKVIDWCQYNPANPSAGGSWEHTQLLVVMDNVLPVLTVPADVTVSLGNNCLTGAAVLAPATATDCSPSLTFTHNSTFATAQGANASGNYPEGVHLVTFKVTDGCGNASLKTTKITVTDNRPPTPVCAHGLSTNLLQMTNGYMSMVNASNFNSGSYDYCTPSNQLVIKIKKVGSTAAPSNQLTFDCTEKGTRGVEMYVTDLKGNTDYCVTYINIQDNMGMCPAPTVASVAGSIETEMGTKIEGVQVMVPNYANAIPASTNVLGAYTIGNLPLSGNYEVKPQKDGDDMNGVSTYDLSLLSKHLLGVQALDSPYKIIAADINKSGTVTTFDIIEMRKLILGVYEELPAVNSWRFIDKNFHFAQANNPFSAPFPEAKNITNLSADSAAMFIGIKVGDLNGNALTTNIANSNERAAEKATFEILTDEQEIENGEMFALSLKAADRQELVGMAFTLEFDPEKVTFDDWAPGSLPGFSDANISFYRAAEGKITFCWSDADGTETKPKETLLMLQGRTTQATALSDAIRISARPTPAEAFGPDGEEMQVVLHFNRADGTVVPASAAYELYQNQPNPFNNSTTIGFHLPTNKEVKLTVFDAAGRLVYEKKQPFEKGYNEWYISGNELPSRGVFSYRIQTDDWTASRKMVKQ